MTHGAQGGVKKTNFSELMALMESVCRPKPLAAFGERLIPKIDISQPKSWTLKAFITSKEIDHRPSPVFSTPHAALMATMASQGAYSL